jgi:hypothetical protein
LDRHVADLEKDFLHSVLVTDSVLNTNEEGTFMVNAR